MNQEKRELDIVLVDEVDNMLVNELESKSVISKEINYVFSKNIFCVVYSARFMKASEIVSLLEKEFPYIGYFDENNVEVMRNSALEADVKQKYIDYIVDHKTVIIIDHVNGFRMPKSHWSNYVYEMVEVKESIKPMPASITLCQVTQQNYLNLYKKIACVTGLIGYEVDEKILNEGYNVETFRVPRNALPVIDVYYKNRPESLEELYELVKDDLEDKLCKNRPVLVIFDSKLDVENFAIYLNSSHDVRTIIGFDSQKDEEAKNNAGVSKSITIATTASIKGVQINLSEEVIQSGGLHVIIPVKISNMRSLEQVVGRSGQNGQPGSVTIFISKDNLYLRTPKFNESNNNIFKVQSDFVKYLKRNVSWILSGPGKTEFKGEIQFPFSANYSDIFNILSRHIFLIFMLREKEESLNDLHPDFVDLMWNMVQTSWGVFLTGLQNDKLNNGNLDYCEVKYNHFIEEMKLFVSLNSKVDEAYFKFKTLYKEKEEEMFYKGVQIKSDYILFTPVGNVIDNSKGFINEKMKGIPARIRDKHESTFQWLRRTLNENKTIIPSEKMLNQTPTIKTRSLDIDFIKKAMNLALETYDEKEAESKFSYGRVIYWNESNELFNPNFYCIEDENMLFVITRGSYSLCDWLTDFQVNEVCQNINGTDIYFHSGFFNAASFILENVNQFIRRDYRKIYFIGHSYGAAVSNVLCLLTKTNPEFKDKNVFSLAFAPPPAMSKIPAFVQECMFSFINKTDIVPHISLSNMRNFMNVMKIPLKDI